VSTSPEVIERLATDRGELVLRRAGDHYEIIANGMFLMDTRDGRSERLLVRAALDRFGGPARLLIGGLGVGFSLAEALSVPGCRVTVVEREPAVIGWHSTHLAGVCAPAQVVCDDLQSFLFTVLPEAGKTSTATRSFDVICLDIDNGPDWTVTSDNAALYDDEGLLLLRQRLTPGGVLAVWSANASPAFEARLRTHFSDVEIHTVEVARGEPDVVYTALSPRGRSA
jgi:spermidine synthase